MPAHNKVEKVEQVLQAHKAGIIEELGGKAFDLLTPREVAIALGIEGKRIPDLIREGWLTYPAEKDVGNAHQYYRWRVEFVKRHRKTRSRQLSKP